VRETSDAATVRPDPEPPVTVDAERADAVVAEAVPLIELGEAGSVEASEAVVGREPDVSLTRLEHGVDGRVRKAMIGRPGLEAELSENLGGVEAGGDRRAPTRHGEPGDGEDEDEGAEAPPFGHERTGSPDCKTRYGHGLASRLYPPHRHKTHSEPTATAARPAFRHVGRTIREAESCLQKSRSRPSRTKRAPIEVGAL
jgi:hypothetical protein